MVDCFYWMGAWLRKSPVTKVAIATTRGPRKEIGQTNSEALANVADELEAGARWGLLGAEPRL